MGSSGNEGPFLGVTNTVRHPYQKRPYFRKLSLSLSLSIYLSIYLPIYLSIYLSIIGLLAPSTRLLAYFEPYGSPFVVPFWGYLLGSQVEMSLNQKKELEWRISP